MFSQKHITFFLAIVVPTIVSAVPTGSDSAPSNQCNVNSQLCCNTVTNSKDPKAQQMLMFKEHNIQEPALQTMVALSCSPGGVVSISGSGCSEQPVCCTDNYFGGLIGIGCTPITITL